jgi:hypothetical protein
MFQVFPNIYLWTTYGIVSALEKVWKSQLPSIRKKIPISPYVIEVVSALERALAMAYTGDARVIVKDLMVPFGLKPSLLDLGLPSVTTLVKFDVDISQSFTHTPGNWPLTARQEPAVASKRAQTLTYGEEHYTVSNAPCTVVRSSACVASPPKDVHRFGWIAKCPR